MDQIQRESNKMDQNDLIAISDSIQLKYMTSKEQNPSISKAVDNLSNTRKKHVQNVVPTLENNTSTNNNDVINI